MVREEIAKINLSRLKHFRHLPSVKNHLFKTFPILQCHQALKNPSFFRLRTIITVICVLVKENVKKNFTSFGITPTYDISERLFYLTARVQFNPGGLCQLK